MRLEQKAEKQTQISDSHNETNTYPNVKILSFYPICHNSDMFRSILTIFRELLNTPIHHF